MRRSHAAAALLLAAPLGSAALVGAASPERGRPAHTPLAAGTAGQSSTNWAGYAVLAPDPSIEMKYTRVAGTWTQVAATCTAPDASSESAFWVGLGGYDVASESLEQIGTEVDCSSPRAPSYYAWYELVPEPAVKLAMKIRPGDTITASVSVSRHTGHSVLFQLRNRTRGTVFTRKVTTTSKLDLASAEWIVEAPSGCPNTNQFCPVPLANFGTVAFTRLATTGNGHPGTLDDRLWTAAPIRLVPHNRLGGFHGGPNGGFVSFASKAGTCLPAPVGPGGTAFKLSWVPTAAASDC